MTRFKPEWKLVSGDVDLWRLWNRGKFSSLSWYVKLYDEGVINISSSQFIHFGYGSAQPQEERSGH